jgi:hypothetical protein
MVPPPQQICLLVKYGVLPPHRGGDAEIYWQQAASNGILSALSRAALTRVRPNI